MRRCAPIMITVNDSSVLRVVFNSEPKVPGFQARVLKQVLACGRKEQLWRNRLCYSFWWDDKIPFFNVCQALVSRELSQTPLEPGPFRDGAVAFLDGAVVFMDDTVSQLDSTTRTNQSKGVLTWMCALEYSSDKPGPTRTVPLPRLDKTVRGV